MKLQKEEQKVIKEAIQILLKHEKQLYVKVMDYGRCCCACNECRVCGKRLLPDLWKVEGKVTDEDDEDIEEFNKTHDDVQIAEVKSK